jgi:hypothetical protein
MQARTAAFEFFRRQGLVVDAGNDALEGFARSSTADEWRQKGRLFLRRKQFDIAADCFEKGGAPKEADACRGRLHLRAAADALQRGTDFKRHLETAASFFLQTGRIMYAEKAAQCLLDKRLGLQGTAARVLEILAEYNLDRFALQAARIYGRPGAPACEIDKAVSLYIRIGKPRRALKLLHREQRFSDSIATIQLHKIAIPGFAVHDVAELGVYICSRRMKALSALDGHDAAEPRGAVDQRSREAAKGHRNATDRQRDAAEHSYDADTRARAIDKRRCEMDGLRAEQTELLAHLEPIRQLSVSYFVLVSQFSIRYVPLKPNPRC